MYLLSISLLFNLFWFAAVLGQQDFLPFLLLALCLVFAIKPRIILPCTIMAFIGILGDSLLLSSHILVFENVFLPFWLCALWFGFSVYIYSAKDFLLTKPKWLIASFGAVAGSLSYIAGERLGAVAFHYSLISSALLLCLAWLAYSCIFLALIKKFTQKEQQSESS